MRGVGVTFCLMHLHVPGPLAAPVVIASVHGLRDLTLPPRALCAYIIPTLPLPHVTPLFLAASCVHFTEDLGVARSIAWHVAWVLLALAGRERHGWWLFSLFYCFGHSYPRLRTWRRRRLRCVMLLCSLPCAACVLHTGFVVTELAQKVIIAHVVATLLA